jgi:WD40 repeat protein
MRAEVERWHRMVVAESGVLHLRPHLLLQQAANRHDLPEVAAVATGRLREGLWRRPWLRSLGSGDSEQSIATLRGHNREVTRCGWSPDGATIVSADGGASLRLWDAVTGRELEAPRDTREHWVLTVAHTTDGRRTASGTLDGTVKVWDPLEQRAIATLTGHEGIVRACAFSPDGSLLLSGSDDGTLRLWDMSDFREIVVLRLDSRIGFIQGGREISSCAFSPDGAFAVSADRTGGLRLWDIERRVQVAATPWPGDASIRTCVFSPDGKYIAAGAWGAGEVRLWNAELREEVACFTGHSSSVNACAFSPDGNRLVSASDDHTLRVWNAALSARSKEGNRERSPVKCCAYSSDGTRLVSGTLNGSVVLSESDSGRVLHALDAHHSWVLACAFSRDGALAYSASMDGSIGVWNAGTGSSVRELRGHRTAVLAMSPDGSLILGWTRDDVPGLYRLDERKPVVTLPEMDLVWPACVFFPDGSKIVYKTRDSSFAVCDAATGEMLTVFREKEHGRCAVAFSNDGKRVATASSSIRLWNTDDWSEIARLEQFDGRADFCAFSPDSLRLLAPCAPRQARMWSAESGDRIATLSGHASFLRHAAFSPSGARIVSGSDDGVIRLWDGRSGDFVHEYFFPSGANGVTAIAWHPEESGFVAGTDAGDLLSGVLP